MLWFLFLQQDYNSQWLPQPALNDKYLQLAKLKSLIYFEFEVNIPAPEFMVAITVADLYDLIILNSNN